MSSFSLRLQQPALLLAHACSKVKIPNTMSYKERKEEFTIIVVALLRSTIAMRVLC